MSDYASALAMQKEEKADLKDRTGAALQEREDRAARAQAHRAPKPIGRYLALGAVGTTLSVVVEPEKLIGPVVGQVTGQIAGRAVRRLLPEE